MNSEMSSNLRKIHVDISRKDSSNLSSNKAMQPSRKNDKICFVQCTIVPIWIYAGSLYL